MYQESKNTEDDIPNANSNEAMKTIEDTKCLAKDDVQTRQEAKHIVSDDIKTMSDEDKIPFSNDDIHGAIMKHEKYFKEVKEMADKYNT